MNHRSEAVGASALLALVAALPAQSAPPPAPPFFANDRVLIVANGSSPLSTALARRYAELRHVPLQHLLVLPAVPGTPATAAPIGLDECRTGILVPIQQALQQRGLEACIDAIVYSTGFPHAVQIQGRFDLKRFPKPELAGDLAALTGLTCFLRQTASGDLACIDLAANRYARLPGIGLPAVVEQAPPGRGFGGDPDGRGRIYLSTMLAWTGPFGLGHAAALANLERSAAADGSNPSGTFYFLQNGDVRSTTRQPLFAAAVAALQARGRKAAVLVAGQDGQDGVLPQRKTDVLGAMVGISDFDWGRCGSTLLPGAIAEHLTSCGGMFQGAGQTKLTAFLAAGAAGASGAVTEPYALPMKFPSPFLHVAYADGCSLAESFYQSITGPYQLAIVGDACCRPFATLAAPDLPAAELQAPWRGQVTLHPQVPAAATAIEAWIDGALVAAAPAGQPLAVDSAALADGSHLLHLVAIGPAPVLVPSGRELQVQVQNHGLACSLTGPEGKVDLGRMLSFTGKAPANARCELRLGAQVLAAGVAANGAFRFDLPAAGLGIGHVRVQVLAVAAAGTVGSNGVEFDVQPGAGGGNAAAPALLLPGLPVDLGKGAGNKPLRAGMLAFGEPVPFAEPGKDGFATSTVRGLLQLPAAGLHEWSFGDGVLRALTLDGKRLAEGRAGDGNPVRGIAVDLTAGWHAFELELAARAGQSVRLLLSGPQGPVVLADAACGQPGTGERLGKDRLQPKNPAWTDGDRNTGAIPVGANAEVELAGTGAKVQHVAVWFRGLGAAGTSLTERAVIESKDGGAWAPVRDAEVRVLRGTLAGDSVCLLANLGGRKARAVRLRWQGSDLDALRALAEIEVYGAKP